MAEKRPTSRATPRRRSHPTREEQALARPVGQRKGKYAEVKQVRNARDLAYLDEHAAELLAGML